MLCMLTFTFMLVGLATLRMTHCNRLCILVISSDTTSSLYEYYIQFKSFVDTGTWYWMFSFLSDCRQRVKIGNVFSEWLRLNGGMPQGTWLGLYIFLLLINDLTCTAVQLDKYGWPWGSELDDFVATTNLTLNSSRRHKGTRRDD